MKEGWREEEVRASGLRGRLCWLIHSLRHFPFMIIIYAWSSYWVRFDGSLGELWVQSCFVHLSCGYVRADSSHLFQLISCWFAMCKYIYFFVTFCWSSVLTTTSICSHFVNSFIHLKFFLVCFWVLHSLAGKCNTRKEGRKEEQQICVFYFGLAPSLLIPDPAHPQFCPETGGSLPAPQRVATDSKLEPARIGDKNGNKQPHFVGQNVKTLQHELFNLWIKGLITSECSSLIPSHSPFTTWL